MNLKPQDPRITMKLLEGHTDVITPLAQEREQFYQNQICPGCTGDNLQKTGDSRMLFRPGEVLPRYWLECKSCGCIHDPHSGIIIKMGNVAKAIEPAFPILDGPED
jgi:hypothetical protein